MPSRRNPLYRPYPRDAWAPTYRDELLRLDPCEWDWLMRGRSGPSPGGVRWHERYGLTLTEALRIEAEVAGVRAASPGVCPCYGQPLPARPEGA